MYQVRLTEQELNTICHCLRVASNIFEHDAKEAEEIDKSGRLTEQFQLQVKQARSLEERLYLL